MKPPPPMPHEYGSTTPSTPAAPTAASTALPPWRRTPIAARVACRSTLAAAPPAPTAVGCLVGVWWAAAGAARSAAARTGRSKRRMAITYPPPVASYPCASHGERDGGHEVRRHVRRRRRAAQARRPADRGQARGRPPRRRRAQRARQGDRPPDRRRPRGLAAARSARDGHAAVDAEVCEIYTDVPGVFSADPRIVPNARKLPVVSFEEMLEMAASGAGVLQLRSVEYARNHGVRIHCRSSFDDAPGTVVLSEEETMEQPLITAVTHSLGEARVTLMGVPDTPGIAGRVTTALADANVNIDMIVQGEPETEGLRADMSFTVPRDDVHAARTALAPIATELGMEVATDETMGKVSIVGAGMKTHPGVAAKVLTTLGDNGINIEIISTSPIRISCVVPGDRVPDAVKALHTAFELSGEGTIRPEQPFGEFAA